MQDRCCIRLLRVVPTHRTFHRVRQQTHVSLCLPCCFITIILTNSIFPLCWITKIRKVDCLTGDDRRHPHESEMTRSSPWCYCKSEDRFQFRVFCCRVIFPLHTRCTGQVFDSLCNLPSIWPRKIIVTSCWGTTLNIWGITKAAWRLKIVVLGFVSPFFPLDLWYNYKCKM